MTINRNMLPFALALAFALTLVAAPSIAGVPMAPSNVCIEDSNGGAADCSSVSRGDAIVKWHPGYYLRSEAFARRAPELNSAERESEMSGRVFPNNNIKGLLAAYMWAALEPTPGNYDFSVIETDLNKLKAKGKRLIVSVHTRTFGSYTESAARRILPDYIVDGTNYGYEVHSLGTLARVWQAPTATRLTALFNAILDRFDSDPYFEGLMWDDESSVGMEGTYSESQMYAQYVAVSNAIAARPRQTLFGFSLNWNHGHNKLVDLMSVMLTNRQVFTCPDIYAPGFSGADNINGRAYSWAHEAYSALITSSGQPDASHRIDRRGVIPFWPHIEYPNGSTKFSGMAPLLETAVDILKASHVIIGQSDDYSPAYNWEADALQAINGRGGATVASCPASLGGACTAN